MYWIWRVISGGLLEAPLYPLKPGVSRGPSGLSGGPCPLGPPRNSTTVHTLLLNLWRQLSFSFRIICRCTDVANCSVGRPAGFWTAGQRVDPTRLTPFVWKVITTNGYRELPLNYTNWAGGQPDNSHGDSTNINEACLHVLLYRQWNDWICHSKLCYVCEYNI